MKRKGFVMIETIIVITVLTIGLVSIYISYSTLISRAQVKNTYENVEYIYKAYMVGNYIKEKIGVSSNTTYKYNGTGVPTALNNIMRDFNINKIYVFTGSTSTPNITLAPLDGSSIVFFDQWDDYEQGKSNFVVKFKEGDYPTEQINFASIAIR